MSITEQIDEFIRTEGKGNARDAVNVALTKIELLETQIADLKRLNEEMAKAIFESKELSTRQRFATMAMQGFCANTANGSIPWDDIATFSVQMADLLIDEIQKGQTCCKTCGYRPIHCQCP